MSYTPQAGDLIESPNDPHRSTRHAGGSPRLHAGREGEQVNAAKQRCEEHRAKMREGNRD